MVEKDLKIFIGPETIGSLDSLLTSALKERGIRVSHVINQIYPGFISIEYDILLNFQVLNKLSKASLDSYHSLESSFQSNTSIFRFGRRFLPIFKLPEKMKIKLSSLLRLLYFPRFFLQHNVFIFLFGVSLLPYNLDLPILKLFRKKTIMWFVGSDIRHYESLEVAAKKAGIKYYNSKDKGAGPKALKRKMRMICKVEKYVDYIISYQSGSQLLTREYNKIYLPMDISNIRYNNIPNARPVVVHAPTHDEGKGTPHILKAIEQLRSEGYDFEFHLFRNTSNVKVRETLSQADIAVDQLFAYGPGIFALESMAAGCAVLGGNIPEFSGFPQELPIIHTDPGNIYSNLKMLLENPELRRELGEKGRKYVEKYHDHRKIINDVLKLLT